MTGTVCWPGWARAKPSSVPTRVPAAGGPYDAVHRNPFATAIRTGGAVTPVTGVCFVGSVGSTIVTPDALITNTDFAVPVIHAAPGRFSSDELKGLRREVDPLHRQRLAALL